jgi:hypothetical protein
MKSILFLFIISMFFFYNYERNRTGIFNLLIIGSGTFGMSARKMWIMIVLRCIYQKIFIVYYPVRNNVQLKFQTNFCLY